MSFRRRVLAAVTTYGSPAYVDLSLTKLKSFGITCAVFDDGSFNEELQKVCDKHGVYLVGRCKPKENPRHLAGDYVSTVSALRLAKAWGYDFLLKVSRRWICLEDPIPSLEKLYGESGGVTFSNRTTSYGFGFRTEFYALDVRAWSRIINTMEDRIKNKDIRFVEGHIHEYAKSIQPSNELYKRYVQNNPPPHGSDGYIHWDWMGDDRANPPEYILWHNAHKPERYLEESIKCELPYKLEDFDLPKDVR